MKISGLIFSLGAVTVGSLTGYCQASGAAAGTPERPNILFIAIDDMNDWVGPLAREGNPHAETPNLDRLATWGTTFTNAHTPAAACHPARVAIMTGVHPATTGITSNVFRDEPGPSWREHPRLENAVTLSQHFRDHGYFVAGAGKIYHSLQWGSYDENDPDTWDLYLDPGDGSGPIPHQIRAPEEVYDPPEFSGERHRYFTWGRIDAADREMSDHQVVDWAIEQLKKRRDQPLFLGVGIFRPHMPWEVPARYFDMYPLDEIELPPYREDDLLDAWDHGRRDWHQFVVENEQWKHVVQAYLASITFADAQVGRLLDAIEAEGLRDDTIIVLWSDHGMHIGEKDNWEKFTAWERSTRVPFFIAAPGTSEPGSHSSRPVNLLDIYKTLVDLVGLPQPQDHKLEGESLLPLILDPASDRVTQPAITSYRDFHGLRTDYFRYIWYPSGLEELYDHRVDPNEFENLAHDPEYREILDEHREMMHAHTGAEVGGEGPIVPPAFELLPNDRLRRVEFTPMSELVRHGRADRDVGQRTHWDLGADAVLLHRSQAPQIADRGFTITASIDPGPGEGVIAAQGGAIRGYGIYMKSGRICFAVREAGELSIISSEERIGGPATIRAQLMPDGRLRLSIDGSIVAQGRAQLIREQPNVGLSVGRDWTSGVGDYDVPFEFKGRILSLKVDLDQ